MYESHWGLTRSPFRSAADPKFFYPGSTHQEALARLHFLVENHRQLGLLVGGGGMGKTLLLAVMAEQLERQGYQVARVPLLGLDVQQFLWTLAAQLKLNPRRDDPPFVLWRKVADRLVEHRYQQLHTVILLDDADQASEELLLYVLRLLHADPSPQTRLTVVLAMQPDHLGRLGPRLLDLLELRIELDAWDDHDTSGYLQTSLAQAGCQATVFDRWAASRLHQLARGVPRQVSQLADLALLAGAGQQLKQIDSQTVETVFQELSVPLGV